MEYNIKILENGCSEYNIMLTDNQKEQFFHYFELLIERNKVMNLTAITEFEDVMMKHFVDSVSISKIIDMENIHTVIDVGTGAGFPGIPLKIVFPHLKVTLLDSLNKRIKFLDEVIAELQLEDIEAVHGRAEDFAKKDVSRETYDLCVSRAVANLATLSEYCLPYVKLRGLFVPYKSGKIQEELQESKKAISILGGEIIDTQVFTLGEDMSRSLVVIEKTKKTPGKYPRKAGLPSKEPLK